MHSPRPLMPSSVCRRTAVAVKDFSVNVEILHGFSSGASRTSVSTAVIFIGLIRMARLNKEREGDCDRTDH
jgi:hypothetical protein